MQEYQERIQLDRYAIKDRESKPKVGDLVLLTVKREFQQDGETIESRILGQVVKTVATGNSDLEYSVAIVDRAKPQDIWEVVEHQTRNQLDVLVEKTYEDICRRVSKGIIALEPENTRFSEEILLTMVNEEFVPAGRILAGVGRDDITVTLFNCYVFPPPHDSRGGITTHWGKIFDTYGLGGGIGWHCSTLRPKGARVKKVNGRSSGSVSWMEQFSQITGATEQGGCFSLDTLMATDRGLLSAQRVGELFKLNEPIVVPTHRGMRPITAVFYNGRKTMVRVTTKRGYSVKVSTDHKMGIIDLGKVTSAPISRLSAGDEILISVPFYARNDIKNKIRTLLQPNDYNKSKMGTNLNTDVSIPDALTPSLAYFLGYMYGNGSSIVGKKVTWEAVKGLRICVPCSRPEIVQTLLDCIETTFNLKAEVSPGDGACVNVHMYSRILADWLEANGLAKPGASEIRVPAQIFATSSSIRGAFVSGYFDADGCDRGSKGGYGFDSVSHGMLKDLQILLADEGILSRISSQDRSDLGWQTIYRLTVTGIVFKKRMNRFMWLSSKNEEVPEARIDGVTYPIEVFSERKPKSRYYAGLVATSEPRVSYRAMGRVGYRLEQDNQEEAAKDIYALLNVVPDEIASIEPCGEEDTIDFEVADTHMLSGNAFYTSNSRRGAGLQGLWVWHPDIIDFVEAKSLRESFKLEDGREVSRNRELISNSNVSVLISDKFMDAVKSDSMWDFVFPDLDDPDYDTVWNGELDEWLTNGHKVMVYKRVKARWLWDLIIRKAWESGEPGILFMDRANKMSNSWYYNKLICTNPCGEQVLPSYGICNLGHLHLAKFVLDDAEIFPEEPIDSETAIKRVNWAKFRKVIQLAVRFLDNIIDINNYHIKEVEEQQKRERRIGLGILGYAELLVRLGLRYGSPEAEKFTHYLFRRFAKYSYLASVELAKERGAFPAFDTDKYLNSGFMKIHDAEVIDAVRQHGIRNVTLNTAAPTGSVGTMLNTTTGIEPYFLVEWTARSRIGSADEEANVLSIIKSKFGKNIPAYFVTTETVTPEEHVRTQAAVQRWIDASISKTVNLPNSATVEDVAKVYFMLYDLGCKGGTVYRDRSRDKQVLYHKDNTPKIPVEIIDPYMRQSDNVPQELEADVIRPRIKAGLGVTLSQKTPTGWVHGTIRMHPQTGEPYDLFLSSGKGDIAADVQAVGRLCSLILRWPNHQYIGQATRLELIRKQLFRIPGGQQEGFGPSATISMPDGIAHLLHQYLSGNFPMALLPLGIKPMEQYLRELGPEVLARDALTELFATPEPTDHKMTTEDDAPDFEDSVLSVPFGSSPLEQCPECHQVGLLRQIGHCPHCVVCGLKLC